MKITLGTTYYENPEYLYRFLQLHRSKVDEIIIIDDYSEKYPAENLFEKEDNVKLYKVTKNYGFNSHGCRNLIVNQAKNDWVCLVDVDREFYDAGNDILRLHNKELDPEILYKFVVHVHEFGNCVHQSVNDFLIHKSLFNRVGGYDEECQGYRIGDRQLFQQISNFAKTQTLIDINLMYTRNGTLLTNKDKRPPNKIFDILESRIITPDPNKPTILFNWERVF